MVRTPNYLFLSGVSTKTLYEFLISLMRAACAAHLMPLDIITLLMFGEEY
jgi:hypothetical protein